MKQIEEEYTAKRTRYLCEVEGCGFETTCKHKAEHHKWYSHHETYKTHEIGEYKRLVYFTEKEYLVNYYDWGADGNRSRGAWDGPGWYLVEFSNGLIYFTTGSAYLEIMTNRRDDLNMRICKLRELGVNRRNPSP